MAYLVLAYPTLSKADFDLIQRHRARHDELFFSVVEPHFTLVFPVTDQSEEKFMDEVNRKSKGLAKIEFTLRCATINKDAFKDYYHTFLVPDEGFSKIVKLHDKLYSGLLTSNLRLDLDFIPHIGIGNSKDKFVCKAMVDEWNRNNFAISGQLSCLTVACYEGNRLATLGEIELV